MNHAMMLFACLLLLMLATSSVNGCRAEVCRRKREVQSGEVIIEVEGCSQPTTPWLPQVAFCLDLTSLEVAAEIETWYEATYKGRCNRDCDSVRERTTSSVDVDRCTNCFLRSLTNNPAILDKYNKSSQSVMSCVKTFVDPTLNSELPTLSASTTRSKAEGVIQLPDEQPRGPAGDLPWWALTVRLPCKPPVFRYLDAYCINSFLPDERARDFALSQNRLLRTNRLTFFVSFDDTCRFEAKDIVVIYDKSVPGFIYPQLSAFPTRNPPLKEERGIMVFDSESYEEYQSGAGAGVSRRRIKRQADMTGPQIGIELPCKVRGLKFSDSAGNPFEMKSKDTRYLINPYVEINGRKVAIRNYQNLSFTLDYGYDATGCVFLSSEPKITVSPPPGWLEGNQRVKCFTCQNAKSDSACNDRGRSYTLCRPGETCQSEVRQLGRNREVITKTCKQQNACMNNWKHNNWQQCRPGKQGSVCRCCCGEDFCNRNSYQCT